MIKILLAVLLVSGIISQTAFGQIEPFEMQLDQISNADQVQCAKKIIGGAAGITPMTLKVFYESTGYRTLDYMQQGISFPVTQVTNQVMIFYTNGTDQYQIHMEMNYNTTKDRLVYIEAQTGGLTTIAWQEKYFGSKFCMDIFANTQAPVPPITKEMIFGDTLNAINQVPAIVTALNSNTITYGSAMTISYFLSAVELVFILFFILMTYTKLGSGKAKHMSEEMESFIENRKDEINEKISKFPDIEKFNESMLVLQRSVDEMKGMINMQKDSELEESEESFKDQLKNMPKKQLGMIYSRLRGNNDKKSNERLKIIRELRKDQKSKEPVKSEEVPVDLKLFEQVLQEKPDEPLIPEDAKPVIQKEPEIQFESITEKILKSIDIETQTAELSSWTNESIMTAWNDVNKDFKETPENRIKLGILEKEMRKRGIFT